MNDRDKQWEKELKRIERTANFAAWVVATSVTILLLLIAWVVLG